MKTVGRFTMDEDAITGPKEYMNSAAYDKKMRQIESGNDIVLQTAFNQGADVPTAVLVALQTDYAGWIGMQDFCQAHDIT